MMELLDSYGNVVGAEYASDALPFFKELVQSSGRLVQACATRLPFIAGTFDLITAFDVLEHIEDDRAAVHEISGALRGEGTFFCTVPAHPWLWSDFDEFSHHHRRYTATSLRRLLTEADLRIERMFYMNSILFAPIVLIRVVRNSVKKMRMQLGLRADSRPKWAELRMPPLVINRVLTKTFGLEARWAPHLDIPFGLTLVCIASKR